MKKKTGKERRQPVVCPHCGKEMVSMKGAQSITDRFYVWYICPRREGEKGCGYACLVQVSAKTKEPKKTVLVVKAGQDEPGEKGDNNSKK